VIAALLSIPGLDKIDDKLTRVGASALIAALALEWLSCVGYVLTVQLVLSRAPRRFAARLAWAEMAFGAALSFGGAGSLAVGAWVLKARGMPARRIAERSAVLFLLTSAINVIFLIVFGLGLAVGLFPGPSNPLLSVLPAAVGAGTLAFFLVLPRVVEPRVRDRRGRTAVLLQGASDSIRATRRLLVKPDWHNVGPTIYLLADIIVLFVCLNAVGQAPPFAAVVLAYQIGYLANVIPIPGGIGVLDSGLVGMLVLYGAKAAPATAAVLVYHAIALWVPTAFGTIAFMLLRRSLRDPLGVQVQTET
jgi:uncharacterized membrane protein YbhN (UPF0104 family)